MPYYLDAELLYLDDDYMNIYTMSYLSDTSKLDIRELITKVKTRPFNIDINILPRIIKEKCRPFNMNQYFGSRSDLNCAQVRRIYNKMVEYFINLFKLKIYTITGINIETIDDNHEYTCILAKCMNIIRGSIKKYARNRTSHNQPRRCSKKYLDLDDARVYKCPFPIDDDTMCPSFEYLRYINKKSCKNIIYSSMRTNKRTTFLSKVYKYFPIIPKNTKSRLLSALPITKKIKIKTRRYKKNTRNKKRNKRITVHTKSESNISHNTINTYIPNSHIISNGTNKNISNSNITHNTINNNV
jgi:hypothetical protein